MRSALAIATVLAAALAACGKQDPAASAGSTVAIKLTANCRCAHCAKNSEPCVRADEKARNN